MRELKTPEGRYVTVLVKHDGGLSLEFEEKARHTKSASTYEFRGYYQPRDIAYEQKNTSQGYGYGYNPYLQMLKKGSMADSHRRVSWKHWMWLRDAMMEDIVPTIFRFIESDAYQQERKLALIEHLKREIVESERQIVRLQEGIEYEKDDIEKYKKQLAELEAA